MPSVNHLRYDVQVSLRPESYTNLPFGDLLNAVGNISPSHFTDQPSDTESGLDHFLFRQYSSTQGRWMTPDPAGLAAVDPANPQTWNRYAYVMNDPVNLIDPLGLECAGAYTGAGTPVAGVPNGEYTFSASASAPCPPVFLVPTNPFFLCSISPASCAKGTRPLTEYEPKFIGPKGSRGNDTEAANFGALQQPSKLAQTLDRAKTCAKAYYGFNTVPGAVADATRIALIPAAPIIPKFAVGLPRAFGSGPFTNLLSLASLGSGTAASGANVLRIAGRFGAPIAVATAIIDAAAITTCTLIDQ
jgi:RHS repeat-associated protein